MAARAAESMTLQFTVTIVCAIPIDFLNIFLEIVITVVSSARDATTRHVCLTTLCLTCLALHIHEVEESQSQ